MPPYPTPRLRPFQVLQSCLVLLALLAPPALRAVQPPALPPADGAADVSLCSGSPASPGSGALTTSAAHGDGTLCDQGEERPLWGDDAPPAAPVADPEGPSPITGTPLHETIERRCSPDPGWRRCLRPGGSLGCQQSSDCSAIRTVRVSPQRRTPSSTCPGPLVIHSADGVQVCVNPDTQTWSIPFPPFRACGAGWSLKNPPAGSGGVPACLRCARSGTSLALHRGAWRCVGTRLEPRTCWTPCGDPPVISSDPRPGSPTPRTDGGVGVPNSPGPRTDGGSSAPGSPGPRPGGSSAPRSPASLSTPLRPAGTPAAPASIPTLPTPHVHTFETIPDGALRAMGDSRTTVAVPPGVDTIDVQIASNPRFRTGSFLRSLSKALDLFPTATLVQGVVKGTVVRTLRHIAGPRGQSPVRRATGVSSGSYTFGTGGMTGGGNLYVRVRAVVDGRPGPWSPIGHGVIPDGDYYDSPR